MYSCCDICSYYGKLRKDDFFLKSTIVLSDNLTEIRICVTYTQ